MFLATTGCNFQHHWPVRERGLRRKEDPSLSTTPQLREQMEISYALAGFGELRRGRLAREQAVTFEKNLELVTPPRETLQHVARPRVESVFLAKAKLLVNQLSSRSRFGRQLRVLCEVFLDERTLPRVPAPA